MDRGGAEKELAELAKTVGLDQVRVGTHETIRHGTIGPTLSASAPNVGIRTLPSLDVSKREGGSSGVARSELELRSVLGAGGMGEVWLAHQRVLDREVAVKTLKGEERSADAAGALLIEALATGALEHPSIVPVHALGAGSTGAPLLVMKRVEGATLDALIRDPEHGAWPALERRHGDRLVAYVEILMRVADALHFAHSRGLVHRDVKPENIMVGPFGETYLLDWGVALRLEDAAKAEAGHVSIVGTPAFMAPELARGSVGQVDARTDVYLLGATLHAVLTGEPPHEGDLLVAVLLRAIVSDPRSYPEDVPDELADLARRAMSGDPSDRQPSAEVFRDELADYLRHRGSLHLAQNATERLDEIGASPTDEALRAPSTSRALAEARFGFTHALSEWPDNDAARRGLARTQRLLVLAELARGSAESAAALYEELEEPAPELAERIASLRGEIDERDELAGRARKDAYQMDPTVRGKPRVVLAGVIGVFSLLATAAFLWTMRGSAPPPMWIAALTDGSVLLVVVVSALVFRRSLLANLWGRNAVALFAITAIAALLTGAVTMIRGADMFVDAPYRTVVFATIFATSALYVSPRLWFAAGWGGCGALVAAIWPALAMPTNLSTIFVAIATLIWVSLGRREAGDDPGATPES